MKIHFIGIGGIGISALARIFQEQGKKVSGSDAHRSALTDDLEKIGIKFFAGHSAVNLPDDAEKVIYTEAIPKENPELQKAQKLGIPTLTYFQALGEFSHDYRVIAIAGTHGKTTTTTMTALCLIAGGLDPSVIVGTKVSEFGNRNVRVGKSEILVVEACEYRESFLNLSPQILVITNAEAEHLDYYKNEENYLKAFQKLCQKIPKSGYIITLADDPKIEKVLEGAEANILKLEIKDEKFKIINETPLRGQGGVKPKVEEEIRQNQKDIRQEKNEKTFRFKSVLQCGMNQHSKCKITNYELRITNVKKSPNSQLQTPDSQLHTTNFQLPTLHVPGEHYKIDASLAMTVGLLSGIEKEILQKALAEFKGTWRRFERKGEKNGVIVIDDYAHHPTEIQATLRGAREMFDERKIVCVFQPHQYSRTKMLFNDFAKSFVDCDEVIIPNIYRVRDTEEDVASVNAEMLVNAISDYSENAIFGDGFENTVKLLKTKLNSGDILITMGAGPVNEVGEKFLAE